MRRWEEAGGKRERGVKAVKISQIFQKKSHLRLNETEMKSQRVRNTWTGVFRERRRTSRRSSTANKHLIPTHFKNRTATERLLKNNVIIKNGWWKVPGSPWTAPAPEITSGPSFSTAPLSLQQKFDHLFIIHVLFNADSKS